MRTERGFGLIEVLVASVILVTLLAVTLPLFDAGNRQIHRAEQVEKILSVKKRVFNRLSSINPAEISSGDGIDNGVYYRWSAKQKGVYRSQYDPDFGTNTKLAMFKVSVFLAEEKNEIVLDSFEFDLIGWQ